MAAVTVAIVARMECNAILECEFFSGLRSAASGLLAASNTARHSISEVENRHCERGRSLSFDYVMSSGQTICGRQG